MTGLRTSLLSLLILLAVMAGPAAAHRLKVFATVEGHDITGYAFFVGGGRARDSAWAAKDAAGTLLANGKTGSDGTYRFTAPRPVTADITVTVNTGEGHVATATVKATRLGGAATAQASPAPAATGETTPPPSATDEIEAAVQRQIEPLLERIEAMDSRLRLTDIMSGLFLIIGLAGIGLWYRGRKA